MYLGQYLEILNTFVILLGIKLIIKQWVFEGQEFPVRVV
jgi:hypothetical protein